MIIINRGSGNEGPYSVGQVRELWRRGAVNGETLYWEEGFTEWLPLSTIADQFEGSAELPPTMPSWHAHAAILAAKKKPSTNPPGFVAIVLVSIFLCSPVGLIAAIFWLCNPQTRSSGGAMLLICLASGVLQWFLISAFS